MIALLSELSINIIFTINVVVKMKINNRIFIERFMIQSRILRNLDTCRYLFFLSSTTLRRASKMSCFTLSEAYRLLSILRPQSVQVPPV